MNTLTHRFMPRLLIACALWLWTGGAFAQPDYQLEKVVELSRHGVRPPSPGNRKEIEAATQRRWPIWTTHDGELTGHGYAAVVNKGRWEGEHYRRLGLLTPGCPQPEDFYVRASPLQRTRATAQALVDAAFPGCGMPVHYVAGKNDPLFQTEAFTATATDPAQQLKAVTAQAGDLAARQQALQPAIQALKQAVCQSDAQCTFFDLPWQIRQSKGGHTYVAGLSALASMVETLRLGWSENLPPEQIAWGNITHAAQITAVMPLLTANYDLSNDVLYTAQKRASVLLDAMLKGIAGADSVPDVRWLLLVAHDTNIAMVRTLMNFSWTLPGYTRGNIPPGSSLVFERWRDTTSGQRFLRVYFQAQGLDDLRRLQPIDVAHPLLREEWRHAGCRVTAVGTLCPLRPALNALSQQLDRHAITPVSYAVP
ncbi:histidine-type phosphatase [Pantoea sp. KPR_PJ]|uniref:histidine-type phosphatase n=1 Tax=Pantoea sp. KPR_PJ TaxID=2738375 RepID=UPI0035291F7C